MFISMKDILNDKNKYLPNDALTIKCTMKTKDFIPTEIIGDEISYAMNSVCRNSNLNIDQCCIETTIHNETKSVTWSIEKFRSLMLCNKRLTLPVFWAIKEFPSFYVTVYKTSESPVSIEIRRKEVDNSANLLVKCRVSVIDCEKDCKYCAEDWFYFKYEKAVWRFPPFIILSDLEKSEYFECTDEILYLKFDFAFSLDKMCHSEKSFCDPGFLAHKSKLPAVKVFTSSATEDQHSIITLQAGDQTFEIHRTVLESSSDVFHAMFQSDMKEKETGIVNITDVDPHILGQMLEFLYSNTVDDLSLTDAAKLYAAGTKYQVKSLVLRCSSLLVSLLSVSNVCDILYLADLHQDQRLLKYAQDFVEFHFDDISVSTEWADFVEGSGTLAAKVLQKILTK